MAENEDQVNEPEERAADAADAPSSAEETPAEETPAAEAAEETPAAEAEETPAEEEAPAPAEEPVAAAPDEVVVEGDAVVTEEDAEDFEPETPRVKPAIPGMDLEVDIVREGEEAFRDRPRYSEDEPDDESDEGGSDTEEELPQTIADASIDLAAGARYRATGKRKTAVARVTLKPGTGEYIINGKSLEEFFPRATLQRTIRQPLETVGYETRMDVVAAMHGGGVSAQAGALRHGVSRALLEADPNLRSELKRRGFLTRDARVKERKKAGLKKARKRPQFSKR
jgi:small subunit ribosomal protein S9